MPFSSEVPVLDAALCHSHSQYTLLSISIIMAPEGCSRKKGDINTVCVCMCMRVWMLLPLYQRKLQKSVCLCACVSFACGETCESLPAQCGILLSCQTSVCYLPKLKAPVVFWGASGRKRNNWVITVLLLSSKRCSVPTCRSSSRCEACYPSENVFSHVLSPCFSFPLLLSLNWLCWLPFILPFSLATETLFPFPFFLWCSVFFFFYSFQPAQDVQICFRAILFTKLLLLIWSSESCWSLRLPLTSL